MTHPRSPRSWPACGYLDRSTQNHPGCGPHGQSVFVPRDPHPSPSAGDPRVIPQPADQTANRKRLGRPGGRLPAFDRDAYKQRNTVERCINRLKQWRGLATRYDKTAAIYLAGLHVAATFIWSDR